MLVVGLIFIWQMIFFTVFAVSDKSQVEFNSRIQDFESDFSIISYPDEFLPDWYANEIRSTSSRIYQLRGLGRNGSKALAVQPISTFDGELIIRLSPKGLKDPKVRFWARSVKNGSGDRPAQVYYRWGGKLESGYTERKVLGGANEFGNEDQEFRMFELDVPEEYQAVEEVFLMVEIHCGPGTGTCAKWLMDDFEFGEFVVDRTAPMVVRVQGYDDNQVEVQFDEAVDPVFSEFLHNYKLDGQEPEVVRLNADSLVYLTFSEELELGNYYDLEIAQVPDLEGNFLQDTVISFQFFDPSAILPKALLINEIMPAPKADLDLPNVEYVEIFHAGEYAIRLEGVSWSNSKSTVILKEKWVQPGDYLLLIPENQTLLLMEYGEIIPIRSWPTLLNSGDQLSLQDDQGKPIDRIAYTTNSWRGTEYSSGGYSLEVANPFYACEQSDLLKPSIDPLRGTPGRQNSIFDLTPDENPPLLNRVEFSSSKSLILSFSKPILSGFDPVNFVFEPSLQIDSIAQSSSKEIQIFLAEDLTANTIYRLRINGLTDCSGNGFLQTEPFQFVLPVQAEKGEVLINELLFNPKAGSPKFVELINVTDNYLDIQDWKLANFDEMGEVAQVKQLGESSLILPPRGYLAITTSPDMLKLDYARSSMGAFVHIATLPSYPIAGGTVVLLDATGNIAETFPYSEELHHPLLKDPKGVSLERLSTQSAASLSANWYSASAVEEYATPGRKNSQVISGEFEAELIQIDPEVFDPEGSNGNTFTTIRYELDQAGWVGSFRIYSTTGQLIQVLAENEILGTAGLFTWAGTDSQGKVLRSGYYVLLIELYDLTGEMRVIRKTIVIATKL